MNPNDPTYQQLQQIIAILTDVSNKLTSTLDQLTYLNFGLAFFVGVVSCAYLFSYIKDVFSK
jgi:hypothetical protein